MTYNSAYTGPQIDAAARLASIIFDDLPAMLADARDYTAHTAGDVFWTATEGFRYRVAAADASDHHLTTAGGVKLYVQPGEDGFYNFGAFNPAGDGVTDDYDVLMTAIYRTDNATIYFPPETYAIGQTVHFKRPVHFRSSYQGGAGSTASAVFKFPSGTRGFWVERGDTYDGHPIYSFSTVASLEATNVADASYNAAARAYITGTGEIYAKVALDDQVFTLTTVAGVRWLLISPDSLGPMPTGSGFGSRFEGIVLNGTSPNNPNMDAHGIYSQARIYIERCGVSFFSGDGVRIFAATDRKVSNPETYGEASLCQVNNLVVNLNGGNGFFNQGYDAQAGVIQYIDAVGNGRWGVWEAGFLGNTHIGHHLAFNGLAYPGRPGYSGKSSMVTYGGNRYVAHPDATEQQLVDTTPDPTLNQKIWRLHSTGGTSSLGIVEWLPGQPVGTYFPGGSMVVGGANSRNLILYCYTEGGQGPTWNLSKSSIIMGGIMGAGHAGFRQVRGMGGGLEATTFTAGQVPNDEEAEAGEIAGMKATLGGGSNAIIATSGLDGLGTYRFRSANGRDWRWDYNNVNLNTAFEITGQNTTATFGTSAPVPHTFHVKKISIGGRFHTSATAAPTTGDHARGQIVWNQNASAGGFAGWICVAAGTPGTWKGFGAIES